MDAARFGNRAEAFPVRIRAGAFADGSPTRDLLVTHEHCILTEAGLIPVRMLVNGGSILVDRAIPRYDFFHVELAAHGILLAEGLATESYLDTGNRGLFGGGGAGVRRDPVMAAPLAVARALVEPVWRRLADVPAASASRTTPRSRRSTTTRSCGCCSTPGRNSPPSGIATTGSCFASRGRPGRCGCSRARRCRPKRWGRSSTTAAASASRSIDSYCETVSTRR